MECFGINVIFNVGVIYFDGWYILVVWVEGYDCKFFFVIVESFNGVDNFCFWDYLLVLLEIIILDINVYDMCLVVYEDGWIYGLFCIEWKDWFCFFDMMVVVVFCGIVRIKDF